MNEVTAALLQNGVVVNRIVIEVDDEDNTDFAPEDFTVVIIPNDSPVTFGWVYADGEFTNPEE